MVIIQTLVPGPGRSRQRLARGDPDLEVLTLLRRLRLHPGEAVALGAGVHDHREPVGVVHHLVELGRGLVGAH